METLIAHPAGLSTPAQNSKFCDTTIDVAERLIQQATRIAKENAERKAPKLLLNRASFEEIRQRLLKRATSEHDAFVRQTLDEEADQAFREHVAGCFRACGVPHRYRDANSTTYPQSRLTSSNSTKRRAKSFTGCWSSPRCTP